MKYYEGGISIDFLLTAPQYFITCCINGINEENKRVDKYNRKQAAQNVINKMKGR